MEITTGEKVVHNIPLTSDTWVAIEAIFVEMVGENRVVLLIKLLHSQQQVSLALADIATN
ncbi:Transcription antitermination protein RfaH [compost metagenome]